MATFEYSVDGQSITTTKAGRLVSGTIGVNTVKFTFDSSWSGLEKWATFDPNPGKPYKQPLDANGECLIPGEVMGGITLRIGAFGLADGQAYPTVWANKLQMEEGCFIEVPVSDWPEPSPVIEEILEELENKVDKPEDATPGNVAIIGSNNNIVDSGKSFADIYDSAMIHKTASGAIVTIDDGADDVPIKQMTVQIQPVQAGSGDPSPSNVRAITGWTGANVIRRKNLITGYYQDTKIINGITYTPQADGTIIATGTATADATYAVINNANNLPKERIYYSGCPSGGSASTYDIRCSRQGGAGQTYDYGDGNHVDNLTYASVRMTIIVRSGYAIPSNAPLVFKPMISFSPCHYDDFVSPYATGINTSYTVNFPTEAGTVYGGELTVNEDGSGTLTVDKALAVFDGSTDETIMKINNSNANRYTINLPSDALSVAISSRDIAFNWVRSTSSGYDYVGQLINNKRADLYFPLTDTNLDTVAHVRTYLASNNLQVAYPLDTPVTYTLTAPQVKTLLGLNNILADTGDISITYRADPTLATAEQAQAIKESIAPVEHSYTASQPYAVGSYLYVGNTLYVVTSEIASGATITPGTNVSEEPLADGVTGLSEWENASITINTTYLTSANALYCRVNQKLKIAVLFGWFTIGTIPSAGATLFTITGIKPVNSYCYTYAHRGASLISMRPITSGSNTNVNVDIGTSGSMATGAHALQTAVIPIQ